MGRAKLRKLHGLLERRGFLAMLAARLMPGVSAASVHYLAGVATRRGACIRRSDGARRPGADGPCAMLGQGIGWGRSPRS